MGGTQGRKNADLALEECGVPQSTATAVKAARVLLAAMTEPGQELNVKTIAQRTGFSEYQVLRLLEGPEYQELIQTTLKQHCGALIGQALSYMPDILKNGQPEQKLRVLRETTNTYKVLAGQAAMQHADTANDKDVDELLNKLERMNRVKKVKVSNGSTGRS